MTVGAGIDFDKEEKTRQEILNQLEACRRGEITREELEAARQAMHSSLRATHDSPGSIENYYATAALSGLGLTPEAYMAWVEETTVAQLQQAANSLRLHSVYFLKGVTA
jgi:predicted Zn-dependent peptidase